MAREMDLAPGHIRCQCGALTGVPCEWTGEEADTVAVEYMPGHLRSTHEAAGYDGIGHLSAAAGVESIRCAPDCAESLGEVIDYDGDVIGWDPWVRGVARG